MVCQCSSWIDQIQKEQDEKIAGLDEKILACNQDYIKLESVIEALEKEVQRLEGHVWTDADIVIAELKGTIKRLVGDSGYLISTVGMMREALAKLTENHECPKDGCLTCSFHEQIDQTMAEHEHKNRAILDRLSEVE